MRPVYVLEIEQEITYLKTPERFLAFWTQLGASVHEPFGGFSRQLVSIGMPSKREGAIPDEVRHNKIGRRLFFVANLPGNWGRVKRDQVREVEVWSRLDGVSSREEDVLERNKETPERA